MDKIKEIKVCTTIDEIKEFLKNNVKSKFCLYLADKTDEQWAESTSRIYMNEINDKIIYLPVNVKKNDYEMLLSIYKLCEQFPQIVCINHTHPHKSNVVLKKWLGVSAKQFNADVVFRNGNNFEPMDCNGPAFMNFYKYNIGEFENKNVIILGVGGSGEVIARQIANENPKQLYLVDIVDKNWLVEELKNLVQVKFEKYLKDIALENKDIVLINCSGKEGNDSLYLDDFLKKFSNSNNIFVDIRVHLTQPVILAKSLNWKAFTGFGMNYINGYTIFSKLCSYANVCPPSLDYFKNLVLKVTKI